MMFDPTRIRLGKKQLVADMPGGEERWQVKPEGIVRVLVNGETIVENGDADGRAAGPRAAHRQRGVKAAVFHGAARGRSRSRTSRVRDPGPGRGARRDPGRRALPLRPERHRRHDPVPRARSCSATRAPASSTRSAPASPACKEGDAVILSTLAHCGRCPACEVGQPTECRNAPSPKDAQPFTRRRQAGLPVRQRVGVRRAARVVREQSAIPIDPRVPFDRAALIGCGIMTGVGAVLNRAKVETGATMAVFGVGGIGLNCVQGGVLAGAAKIIAVDVVPAEARAGAALRRDARDRRVDGRSGRGDPGSHRAAAPTTPSRPSATSPSSSRRSTRSAPGGTLTIVGVPKLGSSFEFVVHALYQNKAILGCRYGTARPRRDFPMLADLYLGGRLKIDELITDHYALDDFDRALDDLERGQLARGVFRVGARTTKESTPWASSATTSSTPTGTAATCRTGRRASRRSSSRKWEERPRAHQEAVREPPRRRHQGDEGHGQARTASSARA